MEMSKHRLAWAGCGRCRFAEYRHSIVYGRGCFPCEVLFVGEAPGKTEDALGVPFVGRAGKLLDLWIAHLRLESWGIVNAMGCRPTKGPGQRNETPTEKDLEVCAGRFHEVVTRVAMPSKVVLLGRVAKLAWDALRVSEVLALHVWHPAYVLRNGGSKSPEHRMVLHKLEEFLW